MCFESTSSTTAPRRPRAPYRLAAVLLGSALLFLVACSDDTTSPPASARDAAPSQSVAETQPTAEPDAAAEEPAPSVAVEPASGRDGVDVETTDTPPAAANPTEYVVKGVVTQWAPLVTFAAPGDTIVFRQMTGHDTETIEGMIPTDAEPWKSTLGEEGFAVTLTVPGAYVFKCNPHVSMGMVGAVVVGEVPPRNLAEIEASPLNKGMIGRAIRKLGEALDAR